MENVFWLLRPGSGCPLGFCLCACRFYGLAHWRVHWKHFYFFFFIPLAFLTCQGVLCSVPGFLHETFLFQEALYISARNYVCAVITLYIDCYTHMIINISHVWCCGEMKVIALWLELFQRGEDWLAFPYWRLYREAGGTNSNSSYLCEKAISKCHFKIYFYFF